MPRKDKNAHSPLRHGKRGGNPKDVQPT